MKETFVRWCVFQDGEPVSVHKSKNDAMRSISGTRGDNIKQIWIYRVKIEKGA